MPVDNKGFFGVEIVIADASDTINALTFAEFLSSFRGAYVAASRYAAIYRLDSAATMHDESAIDELTRDLRRFIRRLDHKSSSELWQAWLDPETELEFLAISKSSPFKVVAKSTSRSILILTLAVCVSGGKAEIGKDKVRFELPPIAIAVRDLQRLLYVGKEDVSNRDINRSTEASSATSMGSAVGMGEAQQMKGEAQQMGTEEDFDDPKSRIRPGS